MSTPTAVANGQASLRQQAHAQLAAGSAPASRGWGVSVDALTLLHRLASAPASAADALKLLHELQVHQVELDLQQAQLETNERELGDELARYRTLYAWAPVAFYVLDAGGRIQECNRAGADRLGVGGSEVGGRRFDEFLSADSRLPFAALLRDARCDAVGPCRTVQPATGSVDSLRWRVAAGGVPGSDAILVVVTDDAASAEG